MNNVEDHLSPSPSPSSPDNGSAATAAMITTKSSMTLHKDASNFSGSGVIGGQAYYYNPKASLN